MEYLIRIGIEGLKNVLKNRKFTISAEMQKQMDEYEGKQQSAAVVPEGRRNRKWRIRQHNQFIRHTRHFALPNGFQSFMEFTEADQKRNTRLEVEEEKGGWKQVPCVRK